MCRLTNDFSMIALIFLSVQSQYIKIPRPKSLVEKYSDFSKCKISILQIVKTINLALTEIFWKYEFRL